MACLMHIIALPDSCSPFSSWTAEDKNYSPPPQTSQLSRFGRETHDFSIGLTTACSSHDFTEILLICAEILIYCVT